MPNWGSSALLALMLLASFLVHAAQQEAPVAVIQEFQDELIAVMKKGEELGFRGRYERLVPIVQQSHDLPAIAQIAVGSYWTGLDAGQRERLIDTFSELSIATYADRFDSYAGETFQIQGSEELSPHVAGVHSVLRKSDGEEVRFDYMLNERDGQWRIVNIVADGVSDLALKRSEYSRILATDGFQALIEDLQEKIDAYSASAE
jgi:phospholipid transport system substrate-binding protein